MTTASRLAKQIVQTAKCVDVVRARTEARWDALLASRPSYVLFEPVPKHPYTMFVQSAQDLVQQHDGIVAALLDVEMGSGNLREELDKIQAQKMYDDAAVDADIDRLRLLEGIDAATITAKYIAEKTLLILRSIHSITDDSKLSYLKYLLEQQHEKKHLKNHIENPFLNITPECRIAVKEIKSLCKLLVQLTVNGVHVGSQLDANRTPKFLKS